MDNISRPSSNYTAYLPNISTFGVNSNIPKSSSTKQIKPSKRINARLQLAAALIEADNEEIERRDTAQRHNETTPPQTSLLARKLKLASESVIFAPYREQNNITGNGRGLDSEGRPVIDFLGVKLPAEKRQTRSHIPEEGIVGGRSRAKSTSSLQTRPLTYTSRASTEWPSRPVSRNGSNISTSRPKSAASRPFSQEGLAGGQEVEEEALSEWGVEKFLSSEARQRIEIGRRSRANSVIERPDSVLSSSSIGRAQSEIGTEASTLPVGDLNISKLDLLARIKMYREGQREVSDEVQQETEQPLFSSLKNDRMHGHLKVIATEEGSSIGTVIQARNTVVGGRKSTDLGRALSKSGVTGDSWSEQGDDTVDPSWTLSNAVKHLGEVGKETAMHENHSREENQDRKANPIEITRSPRLGRPIDDLEQHTDGMAGIGSFSRSPCSRRNSIASNLLSPSFAFGMGEGSDADEGHPSSQVEFPRPRSAYFAIRTSESLSMAEAATTRRQSSPHLAMPSSSLSATPNDASPRRISMLNPSFSPRLRPSPDALLASIDPYFDMAGFNLSPYPTLGCAARIMKTSQDASENVSIPFTSRRGSEQQQQISYGLSTKQLQELAKQNSFPVSFGLSPDCSIAAGLPDEDADLLKGEQEIFQAELGELQLETATLNLNKMEFSKSHDENVDDSNEAAPRPIEAFVSANQDPDLSSARWGRKKRKSLLANKVMLRKATLETLIKGQSNDEIANEIVYESLDDEYTSPPKRGPLRPQGIEHRLPLQLKMPPILSGTSLAPRRRLVEEQGDISEKNWPRAPAGFVLHNRMETVSMKALTVQGASGAKPFFMSPKGRQKHDQLVSNFLQSQGAQRLIPISASAPPGIGRRAALNSTALFRNQLVQHEEEKEGWGWEAGNRIGTELVEVELDEEGEDKPKDEIDISTKKMSRKEKKLAKKIQIEKQKRKGARRTRRKKRELVKSKNISLEEMGIAELSPDEDLDLSETSSDEESSDESDSEISSISQGEARYIDETRPAGRLHGKSLLDVVDERKKKVSSKVRQYGQVRMEDLQGDDVSIVASTISGVPSFRDNPVGFNDTRERMEAVFGPDQNWARETAKRKVEEAKEAEEATIRQLALAELQAEESAKKEAKKTKKKGKRGNQVDVREEIVVIAAPDIMIEEEEKGIPSRTSITAPTINLNLPQDSILSHDSSSLSRAAAQWLESDGSGNESSDTSDAQAEVRTQALQRARMSRSLGGQGQRVVIEDESDDEEDDVPLSTLRSKLPPTKNTLASQLRVQQVQYDSEEEELPLSQLVANRKKKTQSLGTLDINFMIGEASSSQRGGDDLVKSSRHDMSDDEDDAPIGLILAATTRAALEVEAVTAQQNAQGDNKEEDSDNEPLGFAHPQAAFITEQANMIKHLQTELYLKQQMVVPGSFGFSSQQSPSTPYHSYPMRPMSMFSMPQLIPPVMMQQQDPSIAMWASQVDPDADKTII